MWCRSGIKAVAAALLLAAALAGCSDIYTDRREGITIASGEAMAVNRVTHVIDPWPPHSANRKIAHNGERMQGAAERHRSHTIVQPLSPMTAGAASQPQPPPPLTSEAIPASKSQSAPGGASKP